mmetsp:Transcript_46948/g.86040  ORF Transcript_46948/g.86040 Transcript_46948/m.86040 type:complete len:347 (-) Transcript_46948:13-1053(-)
MGMGMPMAGMQGMPMAGMQGMGMGMQGMGAGMPGMMAPMGMMPMAPMGMAPMMQGNPMFTGMMAGNPLLGAGSPLAGASMGSGSSSSTTRREKQEPEDKVSPDVRKLCNQFNIEERWIERLDETLKRREDTREEDVAKLYEVLDRARSATGLLVIKIGEMECGQFDSRIKPDKHITRIARQYDLDMDARDRLNLVAVQRRRTKQEDMDLLEQHMKLSRHPSDLAISLANKLLDGRLECLPDLTEALKLADRFRLDSDAKSKLREICEKRADDLEEVLPHVERLLQMSKTPSGTLLKVARTLIEGGQASNLERKLAASYEQTGGDRSRSRSRDRSCERGKRKRTKEK